MLSRRNSLEPDAALTGLRGLAALVVVLSHSSSRGMPVLPWLNLDGTGKLGVWAFFALSAFLLTRQFLLKREMFAPAGLFGYFIRRVLRIYPMFVVALLLDLWLGRIGSDRIVPALLALHAPDIFWTIPVEFQYYLLLPLVAFLFTRIGIGACSLTAIIAVIATSGAAQQPIASLPYLSVFICGSVAAVVSLRCNLSHRVLNLIGLSSLAAAVSVAPSVMTVTGMEGLVSPDVLRNLAVLWGPPMSAIILAAYFHPTWNRTLAFALFRRLGKISFSLYLLHMLVVDGVRSLDIASVAKGPLVLALSAAVAWLAYRFVEEPFRRVGSAFFQTGEVRAIRPHPPEVLR